MTIIEKDFTMEPVAEDSNLYNLTFNKRVKKRDTGQYAIEPGNPLYGLTLYSCLIRIAKHRVAKKYENANITLFEYLKELQSNYRQIVKLCRESLPDKTFDSGG